MRGKQINFFATREDLTDWCQNIESRTSVNYFRFGLFDESVPEVFTSLVSLDGFGFNGTGNTALGDCFLVVLYEEKANCERIPQRKGGIKYSFNQATNPGSVMFWPGGHYDDSTLLPGCVSTISSSENSLKVFGLFRETIRKPSEKVGVYYVGEQAFELLQNGARLTPLGVRSPREADLRLTG